MTKLANVKGLDELQKILNTLPAKMEANVIRGALRAAAKEVAKEAKRLAPVGQPNAENARLYGGRAGALRDSIRVGTKKQFTNVLGIVSAGGKKKNGPDVYYAHMVEFGTARHTITRKDGRPLFFGGLFHSSVDHPGAEAKPFMRPAMDSKAGAALIAMGEYIKKRLATKHGIDTADILIEGDE